MKTIEAIFTGSYTSSKVSINAISFDYKELDLLFVNCKIKDKEQKCKDKFIPKTPLNLYTSTNKLLSDYLNNNFTNSKSIYNELLLDILSLLYYFKIPFIGNKWIEHYNTEKEKEKEKSIIFKSDKKEKSSKISKNEDETEDLKLNEIIKEIIAILIDFYLY